MTSIFDELPTPEEFEEAAKAFAVTWEEGAFFLKGVIDSVNDALANEKATREEIINRLTFLVTGCNKIVSDIIQEGSRMKPRRNSQYQHALIVAQEEALFEMHVLNWRA